MPRPVKSRAYDNSRRRGASDERRDRILAVSRELFVERGYPRTTMSAISERAGVALDTVYVLVGRKPALFRLLIETAISGADEAIPAAERDYVRAIRAEPSATGKLALYADALPAIQARLAPLVAVLQAAAAAEPELDQLWSEVSERRASNMRRLAAELAETGHLLVPLEEAADVIWATNSPELYLLLVHQRGWAPERYRDWLLASWQRLLLTP